MNEDDLPCPASNANEASPRQVMNHRNLLQLAGIRFENGWLRLLSAPSRRFSADEGMKVQAEEKKGRKGK